MSISQTIKAVLRKVRRLPSWLIKKCKCYVKSKKPAAKGFNSADYWEKRYEGGRTSGAGSYGRLAEFKAEVLNAFVKEHGITKVIEWGCGDGNQLSLSHYPRYIGFDVASKSVEICRNKFKGDSTKTFRWTQGRRADIALAALLVHTMGGGDRTLYFFGRYLSSYRRRCV